MMNMMNMMKRAQEIQKQLMAVQENLAEMEITGEAGNGTVKVICDGKGVLKSVKLSAEAINPENPSSVSTDDIEMLEDLIASAAKIAVDKAKEEMEGKIKPITGGMNIPGLL